MQQLGGGLPDLGFKSLQIQSCAIVGIHLGKVSLAIHALYAYWYGILGPSCASALPGANAALLDGHATLNFHFQLLAWQGSLHHTP